MLTKLHHMMKKYAFEYEKVILQGGGGEISPPLGVKCKKIRWDQKG